VLFPLKAAAVPFEPVFDLFGPHVLINLQFTLDGVSFINDEGGFEVQARESGRTLARSFNDIRARTMSFGFVIQDVAPNGQFVGDVTVSGVPAFRSNGAFWNLAVLPAEFDGVRPEGLFGTITEDTEQAFRFEASGGRHLNTPFDGEFDWEGTFTLVARVSEPDVLPLLVAGTGLLPLLRYRLARAHGGRKAEQPPMRR
jgi:hypothetical protein